MIVTPFLITLSCRFPHFMRLRMLLSGHYAKRNALCASQYQTCLLTSCIMPRTIWHVTTHTQRKTIIEKCTFLKKTKENHTRNRNNTIHQGNKVHIVMWPPQKKSVKYVRLSSRRGSDTSASLFSSLKPVQNVLFAVVISLFRCYEKFAGHSPRLNIATLNDFFMFFAVDC